LRRRVKLPGHAGERVGLQRGETAEGEERGEGDVLLRAAVDEVVVLPVGDVVEVLDGDDGSDRLRLGELSGRDPADAEVADQSLLLKLGEDRERLGERLVDAVRRVTEPR
jgi:hypothetical protein